MKPDFRLDLFDFNRDFYNVNFAFYARCLSQQIQITKFLYVNHGEEKFTLKLLFQEQMKFFVTKGLNEHCLQITFASDKPRS